MDELTKDIDAVKELKELIEKYINSHAENSDTPDNSKIKPNYYQLDRCKEVWDVERKILDDCDIFRQNPMVFKLWCSAFEYIFRCGMKGDIVKDIKKAITNLEKILELLEEK